MRSRNKRFLLIGVVVVLSVVGGAAGATLGRSFVARPGDSVSFVQGPYCYYAKIGAVTCGSGDAYPRITLRKAYHGLVVVTDNRARVSSRFVRPDPDRKGWTEYTYAFPGGAGG
jgi:hypothetical protein